MKTLPAPPLPHHAVRPASTIVRRPRARQAALAELDHLWQRGPAGQLLVLVSATSVALTLMLVVLGLVAGFAG